MNNQRRYDLDWLRVIAILLLHGFHTGMAYNGWWWHIKHEITLDELNYPMAILAAWRMPLLFVISGIGTVFALKSRRLSGFIWERHRRLLVPVLAGMALVIPPQVYYERVFAGYEGSFLEFYGTLFSLTPYPEGNLSWHHLWFVVYLFCFVLVTLPLFGLIRTQTGKRYMNAWRRFMSRGFRIYGLFVPLAISEILLRPHFPTTNDLIHDWASLAYFGQLFWFGIFIADHEGIWARIKALRGQSLLIGGFCLALLLVDDFLGVSGGYIALTEYGLRSAVTWFFVLSIAGYGAAYLNRPSRLLAYANEGIYPFYILHQTLIVALGYYVLQWPMHPWLNFLVLLMLSFLASVALYEIIRRIPFLRPLFGLKAKPPNAEGKQLREIRKREQLASPVA